MAIQDALFGPRCISESTRKPWRFGLSRSRPAMSAPLGRLLCNRLPGNGRAHAAGTAKPDPARSGDWIGDWQRNLRHAQCHNTIAAHGAHAVIPPRNNAKPWKPTSPGAITRNEAVNASRYLGRALRRRWSGYHRRSRVETKMLFVYLLGQSLMTRGFDGQVAEIQIRIAVLNRYAALGIPVTKPAG